MKLFEFIYDNIKLMGLLTSENEIWLYKKNKNDIKWIPVKKLNNKEIKAYQRLSKKSNSALNSALNNVSDITLNNLNKEIKTDKEREVIDKFISIILCLRKHEILREKLISLDEKMKG
jgi:hypothetical protein